MNINRRDSIKTVGSFLVFPTIMKKPLEIKHSFYFEKIEIASIIFANHSEHQIKIYGSQYGAKILSVHNSNYKEFSKSPLKRNKDTSEVFLTLDNEKIKLQENPKVISKRFLSKNIDMMEIYGYDYKVTFKDLKFQFICYKPWFYEK